MKPLLNFFVILTLGLLGSCGKRLHEGKDKSDDSTPRNQTRINPEVQTYFNSQVATCSGSCNTSIAKIVVFERGKVNYCTGTLIAPDVLLTSSNCLPQNLKLPGLNCVNNIAAIFPAAGSKKIEIGYCDKIMDISILEEDEDPALWRNDFAFIKLRSPVHRPYADISRDGLRDDQVYTAWKMNFRDQTRANLESEECKPFYNSYANPFSENAKSPMVTVSDCSLGEANLGAPLFDKKGNVVGIMSSKMDKKLATYVDTTDIMHEKVAAIQHVSNLSCVDIPLDDERHHVPAPECFKRIDNSRLIRARSHILNSRAIHQENMKMVEEMLEKPVKYFQWDVQFRSKSQGSRLEAHLVAPRCFFGIDSWIDEFSGGWWSRKIYTYGKVVINQPKYLLQTKLDRTLHPVSTVLKGGTKTYEVEFNPANAYFNGSTYVNVTGSIGGAYQTDTYTDVSNSCE